LSEPAALRLFLGAFGDAGHAFPAIGFGRELAARGHEVTLQTWEQWRPHVEREGMRFAAAPEYHVFPTREKPLAPYEAVVRATGDTLPQIEASGADVVVSDILTLAPALAGELAGLPVATIVPHVDPRGAPGWPPYSIGARLARTALGRGVWDVVNGYVARAQELGRDELNAARAQLGLAPLGHVHGGISESLALIATFPQLEYSRARGFPGTYVSGPLMWEQPFDEPVALPPGDDPLVLVAPSTVHDREHRLLRATVEALAGEPVRVLAALNRRPLPSPIDVPGNCRILDWVSYKQTMALCDVVVCHGGHGTLVRALASGCAVVAVPAAGDMNENAARLDWAGAGVRLPRRLVSPRAVRLAVRRALADPSIRARARELAAWAVANDGAARAAGLVEDWAGREAL